MHHRWKELLAVDDVILALSNMLRNRKKSRNFSETSISVHGIVHC